MPAKPLFNKAQYDVLHKTLKRVLKKFENQEEAALALGLSQQSVSSLSQKKFQPGMKVAKAIAHLDGRTLRDLIGDYDEADRMSDPSEPTRPNLETCVRFYSSTKTWSLWTLAAARAGYFGPDDPAPPEWQARLDALEALLSKGKK